jgi:hypothetical protein
MNSPLKNEPNMHEPSDYLNRKVGDHVTREEADKIRAAGGKCEYLSMVVLELPPEPVPTAEELLDEALGLIYYLGEIHPRVVVSNKIDAFFIKVRKLREAK